MRLSLFALALALTTPAARAEVVETPRMLTAVDDTRACLPLASGGLAVATGGGLVLVGAGSHTVLASLDGLPDTRVHALAETPAGLWVGTEGGAALVANGKVTRTVITPPVHAVLARADGVWLGTWGAGVVHVDGAPVSGPGRQVSALIDDGRGIVAAFADGPVARMEMLASQHLVSLGEPAHAQALASTGGVLVVGGLEGVSRGGVGISSVDARALAVADRLYVGTYGSGLLSAPLGSAAFRAEPGVPRWVRGVASRGAVRCAATTEGVYRSEGAGWARVDLGPSLPSNDVTALAVHGDDVLVGTFDRGAAIRHDGHIVPVTGLAADETVNAAVWDGDTAWLGTAHGLVRVQDARVTHRYGTADGLPSATVRALLTVRGRLLVGTEEGAAWLEGEHLRPLAETRKRARAGIASPMHATWALATRADGTILLGTSTGLYATRDGATFERASVATGELDDDWVTALAVDGDAVYVGTYAHGVTRLSSSAGRAPTRLGGGYINANGLVVSGGTLHAATMDGLFLRGPDGWVSRPDRTTGRDVTAIANVGDRLWVASRRGIALANR